MLVEFDEAFPQMYNGFLRLLQGVLKKLPKVKLTKSKFRMVDFHRVGIAVQQVLRKKKGSFRKAYQDNLKEGYFDLLEASDVVEPLIMLLEEEDVVELTYLELLQYIESTSLKTGKAVSNEIKKLKKALEEVHGIHIEELGHTRDGNIIRITLLDQR